MLLHVMCGGSQTLTLASTGFSSLSGFPQGFSGATFQGLIKVAGGSEPSSYTITTNGTADFMSAQARVYSGRSGTVTDSLIATPLAGQASPAVFSQSGITAAAGDDVVFLGVGQPNTGMTVNTYTPNSGFGNPTVGYSNVNFLASTYGSDKLNVSAGATGSFADTVAFTGAAALATSSFVLALAAGGASNTAPIAWIT